MDNQQKLIKDLNNIYDKSFKEGKLSVALKAKELLSKELKNTNSFKVADLSIQDLEKLILEIDLLTVDLNN